MPREALVAVLIHVSLITDLHAWLGLKHTSIIASIQMQGSAPVWHDKLMV